MGSFLRFNDLSSGHHRCNGLFHILRRRKGLSIPFAQPLPFFRIRA